MKKILSLAFGLVLAMATNYAAESYRLNDASVDAMFDQATEISATNIAAIATESTAATTNTASFVQNDDNKVIIAFVVCWLVGEFGVHRYVLGTKSNMWLIYTCTVCGIFGIVPTVDFWVLLIDGIILKHGDKYMNNQNFFMWA